MFTMKNNGAELADSIAEIRRLRNCDAVKVAEQMAKASVIVDAELRRLRKLEREGEVLIAEGITLDALEKLFGTLGGGNDDAC